MFLSQLWATQVKDPNTCLSVLCHAFYLLGWVPGRKLHARSLDAMCTLA